MLGVVQLKKINQLKRLAILRDQFNCTQKQVADHLGTTQQTVARWEKGQAEPSLA
jgi:DNA-binding transcriptional regulator YiaG